MNTYQLDLTTRRAQFLLDGDFDSFTTHEPKVDALWNRPIPPDTLRQCFHDRFGPRGWVAFQGRTVRKWRKYAKSKKLTTQTALCYFCAITEALDYVPE